MIVTKLFKISGKQIDNMVSLKKVAKMSHMSTERDGTGWDLRPGGMGFFSRSQRSIRSCVDDTISQSDLLEIKRSWQQLFSLSSDWLVV